MARLFIGTLKGVAFDWLRSLPSISINSWIDLETWFLSRFYEDDTEVTMDKLLSTVQKGEKSVGEYIRGSVTFLLCSPLACHCPCYSIHADIICSTEWKYVLELSKPIHERSL